MEGALVSYPKGAVGGLCLTGWKATGCENTSGQDYTHRRETKFKPYMFSAAESNAFVSVGVVKTTTSPVSLSALDSR